jgi:antitoxin component of MazEF toxin-antitoxin module
MYVRGDAMVKRLTKTGNSLALVLDRPLLEATNIDAETELEISTDGDVIVITPLRDPARTAKIREGVDRVNRRYAGVFRRLAE